MKFVWSLNDIAWNLYENCMDSHEFMTSKCICYKISCSYHILLWFFNMLEYSLQLFLLYFYDMCVFCFFIFDIINTRLFWYIVMHSPQHSLTFSDLFIVPKLSELFHSPKRSELFHFPVFSELFILRHTLSYSLFCI